MDDHLEPRRTDPAARGVPYSRLMSMAGTGAAEGTAVRSPRARWLLTAASILAILPAFASCGTPAGHVEGVTYLRGGIIQTTREDAEVTATATGQGAGDVVTTTTNDGRFSFTLPPGTYELAGTLTTRMPGGHLTPEQVTVSAGQTVTVELYANLP